MKIVVIFIVLILVVAGVYFFTNSLQAPTEESTGQDNLVLNEDLNTNIEDGSYVVDQDKSSLNWQAERIVGSSHTGDIPVTGEIEVSGDNPGGTIIFDVSNITSNNETLTGHLKTADFFEVEKYPTSTLEISSVSASNISGKLTIRDVSKDISVPVEISDQDGQVVITGKTVINRTDYGIVYESGSFFKEIGDKAIIDNVNVSFVLVLDKNTETE